MTDAGTTVKAAPPPVWRAWPWLRWTLLALVVGTWLLAIAMFPLPGSESRFVRDLAAGDVRSWAQTSDPAVVPSTPLFNQRDEDPTRLTVVWTTRSGVRWSAHLDQLSSALASGSDVPADGQQQSEPVALSTVVADTARFAGHPAPRESSPQFLKWLWPIGVVDLVLLFLLALGPEPARATRWGWAWRMLLLPFGAGAIWWLLGEAPWRPVVPYGDDADAHWAGRARTGGVLNFFVMGLFATLLVGVGSALVHDVITSPSTSADYRIAHTDGSVEALPVAP